MYCKFCGKELEENTARCSACGKDNAEKKKASPVMIVLASLCLVVLLCLLGAMVYYGVYGTLKLPENDLYYKDNYTVTDEQMLSRGDKVVATTGSSKLTNSQLQVFYWMQIYNYAGYYSVDLDVPLNEQMMSSTGMTYQQYFLDCALINWQQLQIVTNKADANGYTLEEYYQSILDELEANTLTSAQSAGFDTVDEYLQDLFGAGVSFADYANYFRLYYVGNLYFGEMVEALEVTEEELDDYYTANADTLVTDWNVSVTKDMGKVVDVRHVLIMPTDSDGDSAYSDAEWEICRVKAQEIYDIWLAGEKDEESFYDLAVEYSEDSNYYYGGLYESISKGIMVEPFEAWCMDESRVTGDHGLVRTDYGYHIMYFVGSEDGWVRYCTDGVLSQKAEQLLEDVTQEDPADINFKAIVLSDVDIES